MVRNVSPRSFPTGMSALFNQPMMMMMTKIMTTTIGFEPALPVTHWAFLPSENPSFLTWSPGILSLLLFFLPFVSLCHDYFSLEDSP